MSGFSDRFLNISQKPPKLLSYYRFSYEKHVYLQDKQANKKAPK